MNKNVTTFILVVFGVLAVATLLCLGDIGWDDEDLSSLLLHGPPPPGDDRLASLFVNRFLHEPSHLSLNLVDIKNNREYGMYEIFFSFKFYKKVLKKLFYQKGNAVTGKFFVEAGAMDGQFQSNTLFLEQTLSWTGMLVEPDRGMFNLLQNKNRNVWSANVCLSLHPYPSMATMRTLSSTESGRYSPQQLSLLSMNTLASEDQEDRSHLGYSSFEQVQCFPIETILLGLKTNHITVFSLDVEDLEWDILRQFPFDSVRVDVWLVEHCMLRQTDNKHSTEYDDLFVRWFAEHNYRLFAWHQSNIVDYVFVHNDSPYNNTNYP